MLEVNEETLNQFRRDLQELKSQVLELSSRQSKLEARFIVQQEMAEEHGQH